MTPEEQKEFDDLKASVKQLHEALPALFAFRDNHELWLRETGLFDLLVQDVLSRVPKAQQPLPQGSVDVRASLAALNIHVDNARLSIGRPIDYQTQACLQLGGDGVAAEIQGISNTRGTDGQNPGEPHINTLVIVDNDGGWRVRQYQKWWNGRIRNTTNRKAATIALDSVGDLCGSHIEVGATSDGGQSWYIRTTDKVVDFATYKVGGLIRILKSVAGYGAADTQQL